jgi:hypothetical protein
MEGILVVYKMPKGSSNTEYGRLVKRLYGQRTSSHGGMYEYRRRGLLDDVPSRRLIRGVLIVRKEDQLKVVELLKDLGAEVHLRSVVLTDEDRKALGLPR